MFLQWYMFLSVGNLPFVKPTGDYTGDKSMVVKACNDKCFVQVAAALLVSFTVIAADCNVPRSFSTTDNQPLEGTTALVKSGAGTLWLTQTTASGFSGDIIVEKNGGTLQLGGNTAASGGVAFPAMGATNTITVGEGGALIINDNASGNVAGYTANRFGSAADRPALVLRGGTLTVTGPNANTASEQSLGALTLPSGVAVITVTRSHASATPSLVAEGLAISSGAYLAFAGTVLGGTASAASQIRFNTPPVTVGGGGGDGTTTISIIPAARLGNDFVTYGAYGVRALSASEYANSTDFVAANDYDNIKSAAEVIDALSADTSLNSLIITAKKTWNMGTGKRLTLRSGQLLTTADITLAQGDLTAGNGTAATFNIIPTGGTLAITAAVTDNGAGQVRLVKSGAGTLSLRTANSYSGGTVVNEGTLSTVGTGAGTTFFGSGPVLVDNATLTLTAIGSTANSDGADYTAVNGGQINMASLAYTTDDTFAVGSDSVIYGTAAALNSLERGVNVTLAAEAVVAHAALTVPLDLDSYTINNLGTAADLYYGLSANQDNANASVTIGNGSPFKGISTDRSNRAWRQGVIDVASGTSKIWLQGLATPGSTPAILYLGNTPATADAPVINLNGNGAVTAHVLGNVQLYDSDAVYGNVASGDVLTFAVEPGATLTAAYGNCMGSGDGVATIVVKAGGTLETSSTLANRGWEAFNGDVTVEAGGRLTVNAPGGLSGSGLLTLKSGAILEISGTGGFSGPQAAAAVIEPGVVVRLNVATFDSAADQLYGYFEDTGAIFELYRSASGPAVPATAGSAVLRLNRGGGADKRLVGGWDDGTFSATAGGFIEVGSDGGVIAATSGKTLTVSTPVAIGANELIIGDTNRYDGVSEPKLGTVTLGAGVDYSTADLGGCITVLSGAELRNIANSLPDLAALNVAGSFYAAAVDTIGSISGTGVVTVAADLSVGANDAATAFSGILDGSKKLTKVSSGRLDLTGGESPFSGTVNVSGGELALSGGGRLGQTGATAFTLTSGGTLHLDNSVVNLTDRLTGAAPGITFQGGTLRLTGKDGAASGEALGAATFSGGASTIELYNGSGTGSSADLLFSSLTANPAGTVNFVVHNGTLGESGDNPRVRFNGLAEGVIGNGSVGNIPAWYDTTYGVRAFTLGEGTEFDGTVLQNAIDTVFTTANVNPTITVAKHTVRSIWIDSPGTGKFIDLSTNGNYSLTIASGHLTLTGNDDFEIKRSTGTGTFTWSPNYLSLNIVEPTTTLTLSAPTTKAISKNGPGTLLVNSDHTGALAINEGLVKYGPDGDFGSINLTTYGDGFLDLAGKGDETLAALTLYDGGVTNSGSETASTLTISTLTMGAGPAGSSALVALAPGDTLKLGGTVTYNIANNPGTAFISGGTLDLNGATRAFTVNDSPGAAIDLDVSSVLTGNVANGLTKGGAGVLRLSGANTFDGPVTVTGVLRLAHPQALGLPSTERKLTVNSGATVALDPANGTINIAPPYTVSLNGVGSAVIGPVSGALVNLDGANEVSSAVTLAAASHIASLAGTLTISGAVGGNYALTINGDGDTALTGVRSGTSTVVKNGAGTLTLAAANTYSGATTINAGVVSARHNNAFGTTAGGVTVKDGGELQLQDNITIGAEALTLGGSGVAGGGALRNISGTNTYGGKVTIGQNGARIGSDSGLLILDVASGNAIDGSNLDVVFGGAGGITVADPIATSGGGVTKEGSGILTLAGANTYTGPTTLKAGRLNISGSTAAGSAVTVAGGATLGGTGSTLGAVSVAAGGLLTPGVGGTAGGNFTAGSLTLDNDSLARFEFSAAPANDTITVNGGLSLAPGAKIALLVAGTATPWAQSGTYNLIQYNGVLVGDPSGLVIDTPAANLFYTFFVEDGWLKVRVEGVKVTALPFSSLTPTSAQFNGTVTAVAADDPQVWFCWDYSDKGFTATSDWANVTYVGVFGEGQTFGKTISGLHSGSNYAYRVFAASTDGTAWSVEAITLTTIYLPSVVAHGAHNIEPGVARLTGEITDVGVETPQVWFHYWISGDATTNIVAMGLQGGVFETQVSGLLHAQPYQYCVVAQNQAGTVRSSSEPLASSAIYYVSPNGDDLASGLSWSDAKLTLHATVADASDKDTIIVTNGVYLFTGNLNIAKELLVKSVNGREVTKLQRDPAVTKFTMLTINHDGAVVDGFSITNGYYTSEYTYGGVKLQKGALINSDISKCTGYRATGGMWMTGGLVSNCLFYANNDTGNYRDSYGALIMENGLLTHCEFINNNSGSLTSGAGSIKLTKGTLQYSKISGGYYSGDVLRAGGVNVSGTGILRNCLIDNNSGYGLKVTGGTVESCTITRSEDAGVHFTGGTIKNTVIYGNNGEYGILGNGGTIEYSNMAPLEDGSGYSVIDPVFTDPVNGDFTLYPASPLINAGTNQAWMVGATDLNGSPRIEMELVDMGCYEAPDMGNAPFHCNFEASTVVGVGAVEVVFTAMVVGANTNVTSYTWDFGDGHTASGDTAAVVTNLYTTPGLYAVTLEAVNSASETDAMTKGDFIYLAPSVIYVSTNGTHTFPFDTWEKAASDIQAAIDAARVITDAASDVLIDDGTYLITTQLEVFKGIRISSVNGRDATIIRRGSGSPRIFWIKDADAVIDGFTLDDGRASNVLLNGGTVINCIIKRGQKVRDAGGLFMSAGVVSNCLFEANRDTGTSSGNAQGAGAVVMSGGLLTHCQLLNNYGPNYDSNYGPAAGALRMSGGTAQNLVIIGNYLTSNGKNGAVLMTGSGATLRNSLIAGNGSGNSYAINIGAGTLESCTVVRNQGSGIYYTGGTLRNVISAYNEGGDLTGTSTAFSYCCIPGINPEDGNGNNVDGEPRFRNAGSGYGISWTPGNYEVTFGSPCVNAGLNAVWMEGTTDIAGNPRIFGKRVDMGAYESLSSGGTILMLR